MFLKSVHGLRSHFSTLGDNFWRSERRFGTPEEGCKIWVAVDGKRLQPIEVTLGEFYSDKRPAICCETWGQV